MSDVTLTELLMYETGVKDGREGRGSRSRYYRAVERARACWETGMPPRTRGDGRGNTLVVYVDLFGRLHDVPLLTWDERRQRAARRASRILAALDAGRPGGAG